MALAEGLSPVPSTHMTAHSHLQLQFPELTPSSAPKRTCAHIRMYIFHVYIIENK